MGVVPPATPVPPDAAFTVIRGSGEHSGLVCYQHRKLEVRATQRQQQQLGSGWGRQQQQLGSGWGRQQQQQLGNGRWAAAGHQKQCLWPTLW